jgi:hypothetical protein
MRLLNPKICRNRESDKEKEEGMMTEKSIYCSLCYSQVEQIGKSGWVFCPIHGMEKEEWAVSLEDLLKTFPKERLC